MAGHNKWSKIKRKKGVNDAKRGALFTKLIREITVAAKEGGGSVEFNSRLRLAVETAKGASMPAENIERAIKKGTGELEGVSYEEVAYEGYGPGGVALYIECLTDNTNRTVADVRHALTKCDGSLGTDGSVSWQFDRKGQIVIDASRYTEDAVFVGSRFSRDNFKEELYWRTTFICSVDIENFVYYFLKPVSFWRVTNSFYIKSCALA